MSTAPTDSAAEATTGKVNRPSIDKASAYLISQWAGLFVIMYVFSIVIMHQLGLSSKGATDSVFKGLSSPYDVADIPIAFFMLIWTLAANVPVWFFEHRDRNKSYVGYDWTHIFPFVSTIIIWFGIMTCFILVNIKGRDSERPPGVLILLFLAIMNVTVDTIYKKFLYQGCEDKLSNYSIVRSIHITLPSVIAIGCIGFLFSVFTLKYGRGTSNLGMSSALGGGIILTTMIYGFIKMGKESKKLNL